MKRVIALTLTFLLLTSMSIVSVYAADETIPNPVTARYYLDEHIPAGTTITSDTAVNKIEGLAEAGTGWDGPWSNSIDGPAVSTSNSEIKVGGIDDKTGLYFGFDQSISNYYRMLKSPISATGDGVYYARVTMANSRGSAHSTDTVSAFFGLGSSTAGSDAVEVGMEFFVGDSKQTGTVNGESTDVSLEPATAYDILVKLAVDADDKDKVSVEFVKKDSGFTGNWNYETELELGTNELDFVHFTAKRFGTLYFKNIEIESYNAATTLLEAVQETERILASATADNYESCIEKVKALLPDGKHKDFAVAELMKKEPVNPVTARYYLDEHMPTGMTITEDTPISEIQGLAEGGTGWSDAWGISDTGYSALVDTRKVKNYKDELYFGASATGGYNRHMTNTISTTEDGVYYVRFTMANNQTPAHDSNTVSAFFGLGSSKLTSDRDKIKVGMESFPGDTSHAATVNGVDTGIDLDMDTPYDILLKLSVDADGDDKLCVEFTKKDSGFTGSWDYETTVSLGDKALDFVHFWPQTFAKFYFKNIEIESYNAATTLLDEVQATEGIVASATADNYKSCIEQVEELLPDGKLKDEAITDIMIKGLTNSLTAETVKFYANADSTDILSNNSSLTDKVTVKSKVYNTLSVDKDVKMYVAIYQGDVMKGASYVPVTVPANKAKSIALNYTAPEGVTLSDCEIRGFVWDENLVPIIPALSLAKSE